MHVQPLLRAIDDKGAVISEAQFEPCKVDELPALIRSVQSRLEREGRPCVRVLVDLAIPVMPLSGDLYKGLLAA